MYPKTMIFIAILGVLVSLLLGFFSIISFEVAAILTAIFIGIPSLITQVKIRTKEKDIEREPELKPKERNILREETIRVSPNDEFYYVFELKRDDTLKGEVSSTSHIDIYFVNNTNFRKWEKNRTFECEYCNESVLRTKIDYEVPRRGTWYLLIENNGRKTAITKVLLFLSN